jgi:peptidyl-prolyl cis-trans isomerase SurA
MKTIFTILISCLVLLSFSQFGDKEDKKWDKKTNKKLLKIRKEIINGKIDFCSAVKLYSNDPGSINSCGLYGWSAKDIWVDGIAGNFEKIKEGEISKPFKTIYGMHLLKNEGIKDDSIRFRQIFIKYPDGYKK